MCRQICRCELCNSVTYFVVIHIAVTIFTTHKNYCLYTICCFFLPSHYLRYSRSSFWYYLCQKDKLMKFEKLLIKRHAFSSTYKSSPTLTSPLALLLIYFFLYIKTPSLSLQYTSFEWPWRGLCTKFNRLTQGYNVADVTGSLYIQTTQSISMKFYLDDLHFRTWRVNLNLVHVHKI